MFAWEKLGLVFDPARPGAPTWMWAYAQAPSTMVFDDHVRVYFSCRPKPDERGQFVSRMAFVDLDRSDLRRVVRVSEEPLLPLGGLGTFDEFGTYPGSVIRRGGRYLMYYGGWTRCQSVPFNVAIGLATGDDGERFEKAGPGPVLSYAPGEPFVLSGPKIREFDGKLHLFYIAGREWILDAGKPEPIYKIRAASSDDGLSWERWDRDLVPDRRGPDEAQASPDVFRFEGRYHMFFCHRGGRDYRGHARGYRIGYAWSRDLREWTREDNRAGLDVSPEGWDSEMVSYPHVLQLDGEVYLFYLGNQVGRQGFGVARLKSYDPEGAC